MIYGDKDFFPIESVVISYIDLLHGTNFPELIPHSTTAALLEKHPILIIKLAVTQKPVSLGCAVPGAPTESPSSFHHWFVQFHTPPTAGLPFCWIKENLAGPCSLYKNLQMVNEFSLLGLWSSRLSQLNGNNNRPWASSWFSEAIPSYHAFQAQDIVAPSDREQHHFTESSVNTRNYLLWNFWPQHCIRLSPIPQIIQLVL